MPTVTSDFPQMLGQLLRVMEMLLDSGHHEAAARIAFLAPLPSSRPPPPPLPPHWCPLNSPPPNPPTRPKRRRRRRRRSKSPTSSTAFSSHLSAEINEPPHSVCEPPVTSVIMEELERDKFALEVLPILKPASVTNEISNYAENEDLAASNYAKDEDITEVSAFEEKEETHFRTRTSSSPPVPVLPSNFCHTNAVCPDLQRPQPTPPHISRQMGTTNNVLAGAPWHPYVHLQLAKPNFGRTGSKLRLLSGFRRQGPAILSRSS